ncbi:hypothetical protein DRP07_05245 [Archaeoglobales archaeon]|nr:MAG: hypothetical protein DRP07_05245 [Archaeoglobales archaeon]
MRPILEGEMSRKLYTNVTLSLLSGIVIFLWASGLYGMLSTFHVYFRLSYVLLAFTIAFIFFTALLEHRGVKVPYLFGGAGLLASIVTFIGICVVNGVFWLIDNFPPLDNLLIMLSISILVGFVFIKLITQREEY